MSAFSALLKREVAGYFIAPTAYVLMTIFLAIMGLGLTYIVSLHAMSSVSVYVVLRGLYAAWAWLAVLMVVPVLTMRSFADERRSGTIETLLTAPVTDWEVVLAKFFGAVIVYLLMWLPTGSYAWILNLISHSAAPIDGGALFGAYLGGLMVGMWFLSIGLFCSACTSNVIVASVSCFAMITTIMLLGLMHAATSLDGLKQVSAYYSSVEHMLQFARGIVDTRSIVFYVSSTAVVLFATVRVVEARRWQA